VGDRFAVKPPKTAAGRRTIALPAFAQSALVTLRSRAESAGLLGAPVFCTRTGGFLERRNVARAFKALVANANRGLPDGVRPIPPGFRLGALRHTHASLLLSQGQSLRATSARMGHATASFTLRTYGHHLPDDDERLAAGLDGALAANPL
jgi:integrase